MPATTIGTYTDPVQALNNGLKTYFMPIIVSQINDETSPLYAALKKNTESVTGNAFKLTMKIGRSGGLGARDETGALPEASSRPRRQVAVDTANLFAHFEISDKLLVTSTDTRMSFGAEATDQIKDLTADAADWVRRNLNTDHFGVFGTTAAGSTTTKLNLAAGSLINAFSPGQSIDLGTVAAGVMTVTNPKCQIASVDYPGNAIILKTALATAPAAGVSICLAGSFGKEMVGLAEILTPNNTLYGIDRNTEKWFNPQFVDKANAALNSIWIKQTINAIRSRTGEDADFIAMSPDMAVAYLQEREAIMQNIDYMVLNGGFRVAKYNDIPISEEEYFIPNSIGVFSMKTLKQAMAKDWHWLGHGSSGDPLQLRDGYPVYHGTMACYANILAEKPAALGLIKNIKPVV